MRKERQSVSLVLEGLETRTLPSFYIVTSDSDLPGLIKAVGDDTFECPSLRAAINAANTSGGVLDTIQFAIPGGAARIRPLRALPAITDPVYIDALTQQGGLILDGSRMLPALPNQNGLT